LTSLLKHMDRTLGGGLSAFEVMWPEFYELVTTAPAKGQAPLAHGAPFYVLVEALSGDAGGEARLQAALEQALEQQLITDVAIAQSQANVAAIWSLRDDVGQTGRWGAPIAFDISLPIAAMSEYVNSIKRGLRLQWPAVRTFVFGHMGDGNLHVVVSPDGLPKDARATIERIIYEPLQSIGGAVSAEHGIGLEKKSWLSVSRTAAEIELMRTLKRAMDPKGILNPGRVI
jgi:FAD/FMN-containing dehydrogenase